MHKKYYVFCVIIKVNRDYIPIFLEHKKISLRNKDAACLRLDVCLKG
jgi:hypothetical protein